MLTKYKTLHENFIAQSLISPDNTCLVDDNNSLTYYEAHQKTLSFAYQMQKNGVKQNDNIGIYADKSIKTIIAFLAISLLGARCLQLDKSFPKNLSIDIIKESETNIVLSDDIEIFANDKIEIMNINEMYNFVFSYDLNNISKPIVKSDDLLWLVYSSGTTGKNKGIAISHKAILSSYESRYKLKPYNASSNVGCNIYYLWEVFRPILNGGTTYIVSDDVLHDFNKLADYIERYSIDEFLFTPSYLETIFYIDEASLKRIFKSLKTCWLNGEVVSKALYNHLLPYLLDTCVYNLYSISECHDVATYRLTSSDINIADDALPAGHLLDGVEAIVLDDDFNICKSGSKGELYVHSEGLADGYINRPDLNKERFISAEKSPISKRLYKTGDHAKITENGTLITIFGRYDYFIRLRGYMVSLPMVENIIKSELDIMHCVVLKQGKSSIDEHLVAYIEVPENIQDAFKKKWQLDNTSQISKKISSNLSELLPSYALPQFFIILNSIAINKYSNKLDRTSLEHSNIKTEENHRQKQITKINNLSDYKALWANILNINTDIIKNDSCFFELGGTSLKAMILIATLQKILNRKPTISDFISASKLENSYSFISNNGLANSKTTSEVISDIDNYYNECLSVQQNNKDCKNTTTEKKCIFLTGATGFLGRYILKQCIDTTDFKIVCLVRAKNNTEAFKRLSNIASMVDISQKDINDRVEVVVGDIALDNFGIDDNLWIKLANRITSIINSAAIVNLIMPYNKLKNTCVKGVAELIKFSFTGNKKYFYHVSTNGIFPSQQNLDIFDESINIDGFLKNLDSGYSKSKWAAEKLLYKASQIGLEYTIYRPGNICSVSDENINNTDMNWLILQSIKIIKSIPDKLVLEMTPVDHIAKFIVSTVKTHNIDNCNIYNMTNNNLLDAKRLSSQLNLPIMSIDKWHKKVTNPMLSCLIANDKNYYDAKRDYTQKNYEKYMFNNNMIYPDLREIK